VVWIFYQSAAVQVASVSDGANTYHQACPPTAMPNNPQFSQEIWYAWDIAAASGVAVSAAFSGATPVEVQVSAHEYSNAYQEPDGPLADTPPPGSAGANGTSIGTVSLMTRGRLVFGASIVRDGQEAPGAGFTPRSTLANNMAEDMNVPSPSTPVAATFGNPASEDWAAQMITLK
ncbi:MAG TPA: hypothetical protein VEL75_16080, partial [Candidatus Methylomirabilis sp.]|nr:hypothetical protein [Candidatus Methylomirabilis sp.]